MEHRRQDYFPCSLKAFTHHTYTIGVIKSIPAQGYQGFILLLVLFLGVKTTTCITNNMHCKVINLVNVFYCCTYNNMIILGQLFKV
jgi:hypothetical protein